MKSLLLVSFSVVILFGCNDGSGSSQTEQKAAVDKASQAIELLVESGELPELDVSDSLEGPDTDNDGIRDDISQHIDSLPVSDSQKSKIRNVAKSVQASIIVDTTNINAVEEIDNESTKVIGCLSQAFKNPADAYKMLKQIENYTANTKKRALAYSAYNEVLDGTVTRLPKELDCEGI